MKISRWTLRSALSFVALLGAANGLQAQVSTGGFTGVVTDETGKPMAGAQVQVVNRSTGARAGALTNAAGRYYISALESGGPYTISIRRIGFAQRDTNNLQVSLGETVRVDLSLSTAVTRLANVEIVASTTGAIMAQSHTGVETSVTDSAISRLPTLNRNFTDFVVLSPQVSTKGPGLSGGGQNNRFNAIQIDGAVANDLFGLSSTLQPGGLASAKQVSLEAIKEYQVLLSPFDVRQGNFTGFLVNAVTKSGSNEFHSTGTYSTRNEKMERNVSYLRASPFKQSQEGFWFGGPIIRDKLLFSIAPEFQQQESPNTGPYVNQPSNLTVKPPVSQAAVDSFVNILKTKYGFADPGTAGLWDTKNPLANLFARVDLINLPANSRLVARYNYVNAKQDVAGTRSATRLALTNNGYTITDGTNSGTAQLFSTFGNGGTNELTVGYTDINDVRAVPIQAPFVVISRVSPFAGTGTGSISAGTENSSQGNELDQKIAEFTDNYSYPWGAHRFTVGTQNKFYKVRNLFSQNSLGNFTFGTLDSLINNTPSSATLGIKLDNSDGAAHFTARSLAFYGEDEWQATNRLNIVGGLRLDLLGLTSKPGTNPAIQASSLGINTSNVPMNIPQWSPRIGFNWDMTGDQVNQLRGGTGVFVGNPAYVWLSNLYGNSGVNGFANLACTNFTTAPAMENAGQATPTNCKGSTGAPAVTVNTTNPNLKFPSTWRSSIGFDRRLPWNMIGSIEGMYTRQVQNFYYQNTGLAKDPIGKDLNGRAIYGDIATATSNPVPVRPAGVTGDVINITNQSTHDYAYSITEQLIKRFSNNFEGQIAYTYSHSYDVWDLTSSVAFSNWQFGRSLSGREDAQELAPSKWDAPHRFVVSGQYTLPTKTGISMTWIGESGVPFEYVYGSDMNGDNSASNDLLYVPTNAHDTTQIRFSTSGTGANALTPAQQQDLLENFITSHPCLNSQRGTIMKRNSCRTPWDKVVNLSARQTLPTVQGKNFILQLDIFNFLNLLNKNWGSRDFGSSNSPALLTRRSYVLGPSQAPGSAIKIINGSQPVFNYNVVNQFNTQNPQSNYALQLQLKYQF
jgi:Carboxypeptidase regulatory-like domain